MKYYTFQQKNSGGYFRGPERIIIKAENAEIANEIAVEQAGIYFDGVLKGEDCGCCGNRWNRAIETFDASEVPSQYGEPIPEDELKSIPIYEKLAKNYSATTLATLAST